MTILLLHSREFNRGNRDETERLAQAQFFWFDGPSVVNVSGSHRQHAGKSRWLELERSVRVTGLVTETLALAFSTSLVPGSFRERRFGLFP